MDVTSEIIPLGTSFISVQCVPDPYICFTSEPNLFLQFRQNKTNKWETFATLNASGSFITNIEADIQTYLLSNEAYDFRYICRCGICTNISITLETCKEHLYPSFRCLLFDERRTYNISREQQLEIAGKPTYIESPSVIYPLTSKAFELGEVLQLQCTGEKDLSSKSNTDIRWCKAISRQYEVMTLQENPQTQIVSQREDGCTFIQKSEIFYYITNDDTDLEIMCEMGYSKYSKICGNGRFNSTLRIFTDTKGDVWTLSPLLMYDKDSMLDPQNISLEGIGKTIQLLCVASKTNQTESIKEEIIWCVKKKNNSEWKPVVLQEDKTESMINSSGKITIYSKITYHLIKSDKAIDFMCQISSSSTCKGEMVSSIASLHFHPSELDGQYLKRNETLLEPDRRDTWLVVTVTASVTLLVVILFQATILQILAHKKGGMSLCGVVIKTERKQVVDGPNENYINTDLNRKSSPKEGVGDIYQNQQCSSTAPERSIIYEMPLSDKNQSTYEKIIKREDYEALSF